MNQFGRKIKALRESKQLLQKHVASQLDIDTPMLSKIERGERNAKREHVSILSKLFHISEEELLSLWLADKIYDMIKDEGVALQALSVTERTIKTKRKKVLIHK